MYSILFSLVYFFVQILSESDPCLQCKDTVKHIERAIYETRTATFSGGNAEYEKKKLVSYEISETRMNDVFEVVLKSLPPKMLPSVLTKIEDRFEEWWFEHFIKDPKNHSFSLLQDYICLSNFCCPNNHFGKECKPCLECNSHGGACRGNGTRRGDGSCNCYMGYNGATCNECETGAGYYFSEKDADNWTVCAQCKSNCQQCTGPDDCSECRKGFRMEDESCHDIDECLEEEHCKEEGKFCMNTPGAFRCNSCNSACRTCEDDTRDRCSSCNEGFELQGSKCVDIDECALNTFQCDAESEVCSNVDGSYKCECKEGYHNPDEKGCVAKNKKDEL